MIEIDNQNKEVELSPKQKLIADFLSARRRVFFAISNLEPEDLKRDIGYDFSISDVLAHFVEWDRIEISRAEKLLRNEPIDFWIDDDNDGFNKIAIGKWRDREPGEVVVEFYKFTDEIKDFLKGTAEDELFKNFLIGNRQVSVAGLLVEAEHDRKHAEEILDWRERNSI